MVEVEFKRKVGIKEGKARMWFFVGDKYASVLALASRILEQCKYVTREEVIKEIREANKRILEKTQAKLLYDDEDYFVYVTQATKKSIKKLHFTFVEEMTRALKKISELEKQRNIEDWVIKEMTIKLEF